MKIKKEHLQLLLILLVGLTARIIKFDDSSMVMDTVVFSRLGKNLIEYGRYVFGENYNMGIFFPPGYPFFIGIFNHLFNDLIFSAKLVSLISGCLSIVFSYFIGKELYNREAGLYAALVFALYPVLMIISVDVYADSMFICLLLMAIFVFIRLTEKDCYFRVVQFGIIMAVMFLTRPEGMFLFLLLFARVFGFFDDKIGFSKRYLAQTVLVFIIFAAIISPYMMYVKNYTGKFSVSGKGNVSIILGELSGDREYHDVVNAPENLYDRAAFVLNEDKTQLRGWNQKNNFSVGEYLFKDPVNLLKRYQQNVMRQVKTLLKLLSPVLLPLLFAFFYRDLFRNRKRHVFLLYPCLFFLMYPLFIVIEKQTLLIAVFLIIFSSGGFPASRLVVADIAGYYGIRKNALLKVIDKSIKPLMVILLLAFSLLYIKYSSFDKVPKPVEHINAGLYLKENVVAEYEQINVMTRKPYVNFYSDAKFTMIPYAGVNDVIEFARLYKVDYIVVDERFLGMWDAYDDLLQMQTYSDGIDLFYEDSSGMDIKIFKLKY